MIRAHSTRNTSIRTRKIRGGARFVNSNSTAERGEGGITGVIRRCERRLFAPPIWHSEPEIKGRSNGPAAAIGNFRVKPGPSFPRISTKHWSLKQLKTDFR